MDYHYITKGPVCSRSIDFTIEDGIIKNVKFEGGCDGNTQGVARLAEGRKAEEVVKILSGVKCGFKGTSCPDQLAIAINEALSKMKKNS
jgi:uncharacterized protein (TIGR03905 family)